MYIMWDNVSDIVSGVRRRSVQLLGVCRRSVRGRSAHRRSFLLPKNTLELNRDL